jgi:hypothetical protein
VARTKKFHLGWFVNFTADWYDQPFANGGYPFDGRFFVDMAQMLERACFDYIMVEDTLCVSDQAVSRRYVLEVTEGLVPALQRRGAVRTEYRHQLLRDTLREF